MISLLQVISRVVAYHCPSLLTRALPCLMTNPQAYYYIQIVGDAQQPPTILASSDFDGIAIIDADPYLPGGRNWYTNQNNLFVSETAPCSTLTNECFQLSFCAQPRHRPPPNAGAVERDRTPLAGSLTSLLFPRSATYSFIRQVSQG
jgi:hypothetical protein